MLHTTEESPGLLPEILNRISKVPVLYAVNQAPSCREGRISLQEGNDTSCWIGEKSGWSMDRVRTVVGHPLMRCFVQLPMHMDPE